MISLNDISDFRQGEPKKGILLLCFMKIPENWFQLAVVPSASSFIASRTGRAYTRS
jgi:hypothetical protein